MINHQAMSDIKWRFKLWSFRTSNDLGGPCWINSAHHTLTIIPRRCSSGAAPWGSCPWPMSRLPQLLDGGDGGEMRETSSESGCDLEQWNDFSIWIGKFIWNFIIPTDEVIFFRGVAKNHQPGIIGYLNLPYGDGFPAASWRIKCWWPGFGFFQIEYQWIVWMERVKETMLFHTKFMVFLTVFPERRLNNWPNTPVTGSSTIFFAINENQDGTRRSDPFRVSCSCHGSAWLGHLKSWQSLGQVIHWVSIGRFNDV